MAYQKIYMNQIHSSSLLCQLSQMWQQDILCDAVIHAGTTSVKVHRVVLVAACPMLQSMDGATAGNKLEVKLSPEIQLESITEFLRYLYDGFMMLTEDNVHEIEKIGRLLQVDSVTKCCADFFKVLQSQAGQSANYKPQFSFHADQAEFRHVRASDLLRSMQNGSEKRIGEGDNSGLRKKAKRSNEDVFEVIHVDTGKGTSGSRVCQSLGVSVASRSEPSQTSVQIIDAVSTQNLKSKQPAVLESKVSPLKGQDERTAGRPMVSLLGGSKAAKNLNQMPSFMQSESSTSQKIKAERLTPNISQKSCTKTRPDDDDDQIVIQPMGEDGIVITEAADDDLDMDLNGEDRIEEPDRGALSVGLEDTGQKESPEPSSAELKVVKIEKVSGDEDSSYMGQFEDYSYVEDDGSDTEPVYTDDAGQGTSDGPTWYIQTFKGGKPANIKSEPLDDDTRKLVPGSVNNQTSDNIDKDVPEEIDNENQKNVDHQSPDIVIKQENTDNIEEQNRKTVDKQFTDKTDQKNRKSREKQSSEIIVKQESTENVVEQNPNNDDKQELMESIVNHPDSKKYNCDRCGYTANFKQNMHRHLRIHKQKDSMAECKKHLCSDCGLTFISKYGLTLHRKNKHEKVFKYICMICQKGFNESCHFKNHVEGHSKIPGKRAKPKRGVEKTVECDQEGCDKLFLSIGGMREHKSAIHGGRIYRCNKCGKSFQWRSSLMYHKKKSHFIFSDQE